MTAEKNTTFMETILNKLLSGLEIFRRKPTEFLNYDHDFLFEQYCDENNDSQFLDSIYGKLIPYKEIVCLLEDNLGATLRRISQVTIKKYKTKFTLNGKDKMIHLFQADAYRKFKETGKLTSDDAVIRLCSVRSSDKNIQLTIQPARYSDQVKSNLVLDWKGGNERHELTRNGVDTLRHYLNAKYGKKLPPLSDAILANTIGISTILFYRDETGMFIPYLPKRAGKNLAVFVGEEFHCTASGAAQWNADRETFGEMFTKDMYRELEEETGIKESDVEIMLPVAVCREYLRGGKPQIFFAGVLKIGKEEIIAYRKTIMERKGVKEIKDEQLDLEGLQDLENALGRLPTTLEAVANYYYARKFIELYQPAPTQGHRRIEENTTGITYQNLFGPYMEGATEIILFDHIMRKPHHLKNLEDFISIIDTTQGRVRVFLFTHFNNMKQTDLDSEQIIRILDGFKTKIAAKGIDFCYDTKNLSIHDRRMITNTRWEVRVDRGLDIYQPNFESREPLPQEKRKCNEFTFDSRIMPAEEITKLKQDLNIK